MQPIDRGLAHALMGQCKQQMGLLEEAREEYNNAIRAGIDDAKHPLQNLKSPLQIVQKMNLKTHDFPSEQGLSKKSKTENYNR